MRKKQHNIKQAYDKLKFYLKVNWYKTLYFNFKKFPVSVALKLPVFFYGPVKFQALSGSVTIDAPIERGMIGFGQPYEKNTVHAGIAEVAIRGEVIFKGHMQFGKDYFFYVEKNAVVKFGHMAGIGSHSSLVCMYNISLGNYARISSGSQIMDTNFHPMINTITGERHIIEAPVIIGDYNYISNRVTILRGSITPDFCTVASNTLCTKDYSAFGENVLIGGVPAKLLRNNISRDWEYEKDLLDKWLKIDNLFKDF
jgi:acetyltransferase-like isoleucine patch superfamily enzyme